MIIDEKYMYPSPPTYLAAPPPPFTPSPTFSSKEKPNLGALPSHILLQIVYCTFPQRDGLYEGESKIERQRATLLWLVSSLRLVNRALYTASMHILRSSYLPAYDSLIRQPYSSNPFPSTESVAPSSETTGSIFPTHRELATLDSFIALLAYEDVMLDSTTYHLPREEAYKDLFDLAQPRSRLEDLVREAGIEDGILYEGNGPPPAPSPPEAKPTPNASPIIPPAPTPPSPSPSPSRSTFNIFSKSSIKATLTRSKKPTSTSPSPPPPEPCAPTPIHFSFISVSFTPRRVGLVYTTPSNASSSNSFGGSTYGALSMSVVGPIGPGGRRKTIVEVSRERRDEPLEVCAKKLVRALRAWIQEESVIS